MLKSLYFDSWCAYVCTGPKYPPNVVAQGAVGVKKGKTFPKQGLAWCFSP